MYDNLGGHPGASRPPQGNAQPNPFANAFYGAGPGLIKGGLSAYGEKILGSSSEYVQSNGKLLCCSSLLRIVLCLPSVMLVSYCCNIAPGHWTRITEPVGGRLSYKSPMYDINAPDLYITFMAFGTYVVLAGLSLGLHAKSSHRVASLLYLGMTWVCYYQGLAYPTAPFSPEALNWVFIKGLFGWFIQISLLKMSLLSLGSAEAPLLDIVAYSGYTFAGLSLAVLGKIISSYSYYFILPWEYS